MPIAALANARPEPGKRPGLFYKLGKQPHARLNVEKTKRAALLPLLTLVLFRV